MKKFIYLSFVFLFVQSFCLYAQYYPNRGDLYVPEEEKKPFEIEERSFELGLTHLNLNFANNFLKISEVFQDVVVIDIDKLTDGFMFNLGLNVTPFYFTYKSKEGWGFGLSTDIEGVGMLGISGNMLSLNEAVKEDSDIGGALFASTTINTFFNVQKFKVKVNPSLYYALAYLTPSRNSSSGLTYTLDYSNGTIFYVDYNMRLYTGFPLDDLDNFKLTSKPGMDFSVGVEYPLAKEIGLTETMPFLDFDVSFDLINVPFIPSTITDYKQLKVRVGKDNPITFFGDDGGDFLSFLDTINDLETGEDEIRASRPFKMIIRADWRPINGKKILTVTPVIGFCLNELYYNPFSFEIGLNVGLNLANFFLVKAGINYTDRIYINSLSLALNLKALEIDIGADLRSQKADQSWTDVGLGVNFGLKFGW
jgi:hypothetical protein